MQEGVHHACGIHRPISCQPNNDEIYRPKENRLRIEVSSGATIEEIHTFTLPLGYVFLLFLSNTSLEIRTN